MKNNMKKAPVKFRDDLTDSVIFSALYYLFVFVFAPNQ